MIYFHDVICPTLIHFTMERSCAVVRCCVYLWLRRRSSMSCIHELVMPLQILTCACKKHAYTSGVCSDPDPPASPSWGGFLAVQASRRLSQWTRACGQCVRKTRYHLSSSRQVHGQVVTASFEQDLLAMKVVELRAALEAFSVHKAWLRRRAPAAHSQRWCAHNRSHTWRRPRRTTGLSEHAGVHF